MNKQNEQSENEILVVGLGASAGGLQALQAFFSSLPDNPGMAFIVIMHLSPDHESNMPKLLQAKTTLEVSQVKERTDIKPNHVYVIPPNKLLEVGDNHLELTEPDNGHNLASIDLLFKSLGKVKQRKAAGIIFSGAGSDGTTGIKTIKEHGGLVLVQEPKEAQYADMPWSAIDSGLADFVLPVDEMAEQLQGYQQGLDEISLAEVKDGDKKILQQIFTRIRSKTGHDFSNYKRSSVLRRIERRMQVHRVGDLQEYLTFLKEHPDEINELFQDLLISVTNFFRDPDAFVSLKEEVIPKLFEGKEPQDQLRVWVPGCATGEEAYSIGILLQEYARSLDAPPDIKIFASDIDEAALNIAREGRYPDSIAADVSPDRLDRFFSHEGPQYRVKEKVREMILFAPHNLLRDPPFSKLDMVACRNLLIYLNRELQSQVFNLFHYALRSQGYLFLGLSDSNLEASELFKPLDKKLRLYRRTPTSESYLQIPQTHLHTPSNKPSIPYYSRRLSGGKPNFKALHRNLLARLYAPQSVLVNENFKVIHATDDITKYLEYSGGSPSHDVLQMVKSDLRQPLQGLLFALDKNPGQHLKKEVQLHTEQGPKHVEIIVHPVSDKNFSEGLIHIVFKEVVAVSGGQSGEKKLDEGALPEDGSGEIIEALESELDSTKEQLQITVEEYETSNEELRASNEELQSMNEELQSTTEELETSREELQSVNEELKAVNQELESKVETLNEANNDLKNLMEATEVGIVFLDRKFCVQRFTSKATNIFNLIESDRGRPLEHVTHQLDEVDILRDVKEVQKKGRNIKKVISSADGAHWYILRIRPYRTMKDRIEGVVLSFVEVTQLKEAKEMLEQKARQGESLARLGLYALDDKQLGEVEHRAIQIICEILDLDFCLLYEFVPENDALELREAVGTGFKGDCPEDLTIDNSPEWDVGYAFEEDDVLVIENYADEEQVRLLPELAEADITSGVHIIVEGTEHAYGVLSAYASQQRAFSEHDISFLQVIANLIGEAMDRKQARDRLEQRNRQLVEQIEQSKKYQKEILHNSVSERWNLGGYLHDNLAQLLVSSKISLVDIQHTLEGDREELAADLKQIIDTFDEGIADIRNLTHELIPVDIEREGISQAFRFLMKQLQQNYNVNCKLETGEIIEKIKSREVATNMYYVVQEAIKNAAIHGKADNIGVVIKEEDDYLSFQITDDGNGLSETVESKGGGGSGINIMRHRMELLRGIFQIEDLSGSGGVRVSAKIPLMYLDGEEE